MKDQGQDRGKVGMQYRNQDEIDLEEATDPNPGEIVLEEAADHHLIFSLQAIA
jgi:hypothetical protein